MKRKTLCIIGGSGFVGSHLINKLVKQGYWIRVLSRHPDRHRQLSLMPSVEVNQVDFYDPASLTQQMDGCEAVINLVGILNESGDNGAGFHRAHVELPEKIAAACQASGVARLLHMSALRADARSGASHYLKTKGEGEDRVHQAASEGLKVTSFRPSVIFGPGDAFFNRFAQLLATTPFVFPLTCANSRFAPVYIGDVVDAFTNALSNDETIGQRYNLCGPHTYTLEQLVRYTAQLTGASQAILPIRKEKSKWLAVILDKVPGKPFSLDNFRSLQIDSVCISESGFADLGIQPRTVEAVVPSYLGKASQRAHYDDYRSMARR